MAAFLFYKSLSLLLGTALLATATPTGKPSIPGQPAMLPKTPKQPAILLPGAVVSVAKNLAGGSDASPPATAGESDTTKPDSTTGDEDAGPAVKEPVSGPAVKEPVSGPTVKEPVSGPTVKEPVSGPAKDDTSGEKPADESATAAGSSSDSTGEKAMVATTAATALEVKEKPKEAEPVTPAKLWYTVGIFSDGNAPVSSYYVPINDDELQQVCVGYAVRLIDWLIWFDSNILFLIHYCFPFVTPVL